MRKCASTCHTGRYLWVILAAAMASGCFGNDTKPPANDALGSGGEAVNPTVAGAPTITGAAIDEVLVGRLYKFKPTATDPDGNALTFAITGKPAWAQFDTKTGILSGKPQAKDVGEYTGIEISVSNGQPLDNTPGIHDQRRSERGRGCHPELGAPASDHERSRAHQSRWIPHPLRPRQESSL